VKAFISKMTTLIEAIDLVTNFYTYEGVVNALNRVSLSIDHGITFGLVGESGCGKSVFVRSLMRIIQEPGRIDGGKVLFYRNENETSGPIDLLRQSEAYMQRLRGDKISMIFQEPNAALNPIMSIGDQVAESFMFHRKREMCEKLSRMPITRQWNRRLRKEALRRSIELIERLGIPNAADIVRQYPHNLSGGMKQRIVIAIALACRPILLIADEATSNLDVTIQAQILELLQALKKTEISSVLLITHDLGVVAETCDRVGVMYAGNLCEVAGVKHLFQHPLHPYTRALLDAVPKFSRKGELQSIEGNVPNLVSPPSGCRFHPRCRYAKDICRKKFPAMVEIEMDHAVACYLWTDRPRNGPDDKPDG